MPEHLLVSPFFHEGVLRGFVGNVAHVAEIGGMAPGSFASNATDIYQEGLRLPPVKIMEAGEPVRDVWRIILANHRTPDSSWGDFNAMIGSLHVGMRRLAELYDQHGPDRIEEGIPALYDYAEAWIRREISELKDGVLHAEDSQEDDGFDNRPYCIRVDVTVSGDQLVVDYSRSDPQAVGPINAPYLVTASATCSAIFFVIGGDAPINAGAVRPIDIIAPAGTMVNVRHPGPCVGGQTELQPRLIDLIQGLVLSQVAPERTAAACGGTGCNFLFGGVHPRSGHYYTHYNFEGIGWGGRAGADGNSAVCVPNGNCQNTPLEVFETRFPWLHAEYRLNTDGGGPGRTRGGVGITRTMTVEADEIVCSALFDRARRSPWGVFGGGDGQRSRLLVRRAGQQEWQSFGEAFGTASNSKFSNIRLHRGDTIMLTTPSGGGYGPPLERSADAVAADLRERIVSAEDAAHIYGVALLPDGTIDEAETARLRANLAGPAQSNKQSS